MTETGLAGLRSFDANTPRLTDVPETMLWPLWNRASEAQRKDRLIEDPMSLDLFHKINYDFRASFGNPTPHHAIRARTCDDLIKHYLTRTTEDPVVVALGDGLETQLWRVDAENVPWVSVDLPESIAVRKQFLPYDDRAILIAKSALDLTWMDDIPSTANPFISAAGLLMYFTEKEVVGLLSAIFDRFEKPEVFFDTITPIVARKTCSEKGVNITKNYKAPRMPWGIKYPDIPAFLKDINEGLETHVTPYHLAFPSRTRLYRLLSLIPGVARTLAGALVQVTRQ